MDKPQRILNSTYSENIMNAEDERNLDELWKKILKYKTLNRIYRIMVDSIDKIFTLPTSLFSLFAGSLIGTLSGLATNLHNVSLDRFGFLVTSIILMIISAVGFLYIYLCLENIRRKIKIDNMAEKFKSEEVPFLNEIGIIRIKLCLALETGILSFILSVMFLII